MRASALDRSTSTTSAIDRHELPWWRVGLGPVLVTRTTGGFDLPFHWNPEHSDVDERGFRTRVRGPSHEAFESALSEIGYELSDCYGVAAGQGEQTWDYAFPRNLDWRNLPVVGSPDIVPTTAWIGRLGDFGTIAIDQEIHRRAEELVAGRPLDAAIGASLVVVDCASMSDASLWKAIAPHARRILVDDIPVRWFDGLRMHVVDRRRILTLVDRMRARDRFIWSFSVNATIMGSRVLHEQASAADMSRRMFANTMPRLGGYGWKAWSPLAMQILHELDRRPETIVPDPEVDRRRGSPDGWFALNRRRLVHGLPFVSSTEDGGPILWWMGTGRRNPIVGLSRTSSTDPMEATSWEADELGSIVSALQARGWVEWREETTAITPAGRRFLEAMGRCLDDPDVVLRWHGRGSADIPEMDAWINRSFRALKRRVAGKPASPYVETEGGEDLRERENMAVFVYGVVVDLTAMDDSTAERIREMCLVERGRDPLDRRWGIVETPGRLRTRSIPNRAWFGVPVGVAYASSDLLYGAYADMSEVEGRVDEILSFLPDAARDIPSSSSRCIASVGQAPDGSERNLLPAPAMTFEDRLATDVVFVGWVQDHADIGSAGSRERHLSRTHRLVPPRDMSRDLGMGVQGGGRPSATTGKTWEGIEIGAIVEGRGFVPVIEDTQRLRSFLDRRLRAFSRRLIGDPGGDFGTWVLTTDGPVPYDPPHPGMSRLASDLSDARACRGTSGGSPSGEERSAHGIETATPGRA